MVLSAELAMRKLGMAGNPYMVCTNPSNASRKAVAQGLQGLF
jgi:ribonucleotide monophosphatase NagD (HAD superfamily)